MNNFKITIDENAEKILFNMIEKSEYDCLAIKPSQHCIKNIDLVVDHKKNYDNCKIVGKNKICYNNEIASLIEEFFLKYEDDTFLMKMITRESQHCSSCSKKTQTNPTPEN